MALHICPTFHPATFYGSILPVKYGGETSKLKRVKTPPGNTQEILSASRQGGVEKINIAILIGNVIVSCMMQLQAQNLLDNKIIGC